MPSTLQTPPSPDARIGLKPGRMDSTRRVMHEPAGEAIWNLRLLSNSPPSENFKGVTNSDLAFRGQYAIQGNYNGYQVWDISNPRRPTLKTSYLCPASQSDVSVFGNLLFVSAEAPSARLDCGTQGVRDTVSRDRIRGIRIFDAPDIANPKYVANVQTCRGSHTHTLVTSASDKENIYVYGSGTGTVRSGEELEGCSGGKPEADKNT
ncbi:MAG: LVIVD repeat-containing protein, partial [Vicinamibacterales bacterium]